MNLGLKRTGAVERLLHLARRRAARLAVAAALGLPVPLAAQSPSPAEPSTKLLPPRPMVSPARPWAEPAAAPPGPAAALGAPVGSEGGPAPPVWRGVMDGLDAPLVPPGAQSKTGPALAPGGNSMMWVVKPNGS